MRHVVPSAAAARSVPAERRAAPSSAVSVGNGAQVGRHSFGRTCSIQRCGAATAGDRHSARRLGGGAAPQHPASVCGAARGRNAAGTDVDVASRRRGSARDAVDGRSLVDRPGRGRASRRRGQARDQVAGRLGARRGAAPRRAARPRPAISRREAPTSPSAEATSDEAGLARRRERCASPTAKTEVASLGPRQARRRRVDAVGAGEGQGGDAVQVDPAGDEARTTSSGIDQRPAGPCAAEPRGGGLGARLGAR